MFIHYSLRIIYTYLSTPFHVTIGIRKRGVLSPYLFAVHLDDLSLELNKIEAGCIGEVLSNHLRFVDDICVFCPSVRVLQSILDVCQSLMQGHMKLFSTAAKLFVRCLRLRPPKARSSRY